MLWGFTSPGTQRGEGGQGPNQTTWCKRRGGCKKWKRMSERKVMKDVHECHWMEKSVKQR